MIWRRWSGRRPTGIDRVCLAYLAQYSGRSQAVIQYRGVCRVVDQASSTRLFALLQNPPRHFKRDLVATLAKAALKSPEPGKGRPYLNIGHTGLDRSGLADWVRRSAVRPVYFVHDIIPVTHPHFCRAGEDQRHERRMRMVLETGAGVIANSQATIDDLTRFGRARGLPIPPMLAAWLGTPPMASPGPQLAPERPTFVILGTIEGRKNHILLLDLWARLADRLGDRAPRLLIVGQRGWEAERVFAMLGSDPRLSGLVTEINRCEDRALAAHIASARALLFPSFAEGFGLPLTEALALGTPVIASKLPVFREIGQGVPDLIDPTDSKAWETAILDYCNDDSAARAAQLARIKTFRPPSWADHFARVDPWLEML